MSNDEKEVGDETRLVETNALVGSVLRDVHNEYYTWEQEYCTSAIAALTVEEEEEEEEAGKVGSSRLARAESYTQSWSSEGAGLKLSDTIDQQIVHFYSGSRKEVDVEGGMLKPKHTRKVQARCIIQAPPLIPCSAYEFCVPSTRNFHVGDDSNALTFNPFPDGPDDVLLEYAQMHKYFAWQLPRADTDEENILLEATHRLVAYHDLTIEDIANSAALKRVITSDDIQTEYSRVLFITTQRDFIHWKWPRITGGDVSAGNMPPEASDLRGRLDKMIKAFCPNLNCIEPYCAPHEGLVPPAGQPLQEVLHKLPEPCGKDCFMIAEKSDEIYVIDGERHDKILATYKQIISVCPNLTPCQLAVACWCKCSDIWFVQKGAAVTTLPRLIVHTPVNGNKRKKDIPRFADIFDSAKFIPCEPCDHDGPCSLRNDCACYRNKSYCEKSCRCSPSCVRRHPGCNCKPSGTTKQACKTASCPCLKAWRECDPEKCKSCKSHCKTAFHRHFWNTHRPTIDHDESGCHNAQIQSQERKAVVVKEAEFGFGLFLTEAIKKDALVAEYSGELMLETSVLSRGCIADAKMRNYVYELNKALSLDGGRMGSDMRFINHSPKANCKAKTILVNGEHRIGVYAMQNLRAGDELFLDYGTQFFKKNA